MSTLSSSSSYDDAVNEYRNTLCYERNESVTEAYRHAEACSFLIQAAFSSATKGSNTLGFRVDLLTEERDRAIDYARKNDTSRQPPALTYSDLRNTRRR